MNSDHSTLGLSTRSEGGAAALTSLVLPVGTSLGRYVVLGRLGSGGMGIVYAAYDETLDRKVAIKLLHADIDARRSSEGRARLLREAKALAQLNHPNVVTVHDVGMVDERVYLAMEHVDGLTVTAWLAARSRTREEILEVFAAAGVGLAAAHEKGLIHRDFKPDNVMVGSRGQVRVMDFGLARAHAADDGGSLHQSGAEHVVPGDGEPGTPAAVQVDESGVLRPSGDSLSTPLTRRSTLVGTPAYMAPEQWRHQSLDARTDQFSYCVALYEALYGVRPFAGSVPGALMVSVCRGHVDAAPTGSRVPAWLRRVLLRGLDTAPDERFVDMPALLAALRDDPTRARRRWLAMGAVGVVVGGVVLGTQLVESRRAAQCEATGEAVFAVWSPKRQDALHTVLVSNGGSLGAATHERVAPRLQAYAEAWADVATATCTTPPRGAVDGHPLVERATTCLDERRTRLVSLLDAIEHGGQQAVERAVRSVAALPDPTRCADEAWLSRQPAEPDDPEIRQRIDATRATVAQVWAQLSLGRYRDAAALGSTAIEAAKATQWAPLVAEAHYARARSLQKDGQLDAAYLAHADAYFTAATVEDFERMRLAANGLTTTSKGLQRREQAHMWSRLADVTHQRLEIPQQDMRTARWLDVRARLLLDDGDIEGAIGLHQREIAIIEELLGPSHPDLAASLSALAICYSASGDGEAALPLLERSYEIESKALGPEHPDLAWALIEQAMAHGVEQRYDESHALSERALAIREAVFGPEHRFVGDVLEMMCAADADRGRLDRAAQECARALSIRLETVGSEHHDTGWTRFNLGLVAQQRGDLSQAREQYGEAVRILDATKGTEHPQTMASRRALAALDDPAAVPGHDPHGHPGHDEHAGPDEHARPDGHAGADEHARPNGHAGPDEHARPGEHAHPDEHARPDGAPTRAPQSP